MNRRSLTSFASVLGAGVLVTGALVTAGPAYADDHPHFGGSPTGPSTATINGSQTTVTVHPGHTGSSGTSGSTGTSSGPPVNFYGPISPTSTLQNACNPQAYGPGGYSPTFALPAPCIQPTAGPQGPKAPAAPVITTQMVVDAASVTAPTSPPHVEPGALSFVNIPNNYWTDAGVVHTAVTVLGKSIPLTWTPTSTTWNFGDGASATGDGIEGAAVGAAGSVEHSYAQQGTYAITTATTYTLSFVLPGQGAQAISLTSPPSPAVTLPVREIQTLVDYAS